MLLLPLVSEAYTKDQIVVFDGITYSVNDAVNNYLTVIGTTKSGELTIPGMVNDGKDVTFTVTKMQLRNVNETEGRSGNFNNVTKLVLPNTITDIGNPGRHVGLSDFLNL